MSRLPAPSDYLAPEKVAAQMRAASAEQDALDEACGWPELETVTRHNAERRWLDEQAETETLPGIEVFDVGDWEGEPAPPRRWIVPGWISPNLNTLGGKGGDGKSLGIQQWLSAISVGADFMGTRAAAPVPVMYVNCEDELDELHRRQEGIARALGRSMGSFRGRVHLVARMGCDNALGTIDATGNFKPSSLFHVIRDAALARGVKVIGLDNAMQLFTGNLNDPREVTVFCNALTRLAVEIDGAVILALHTAKTDGSEFAGSMAWENAARMRLFLHREADADETGGNVRFISRNKANYAATGERLEMEWRDDAFHPLDRDGTHGKDRADEAAFLACLDAATAAKRNVSHIPGSNYACKAFARMPEAGRRSAKTLADAMERLIHRRVIEVDRPLWQDAHYKWKTGLKRAEKSGNPPPATPSGDLRQPPSQAIENKPATIRPATPPYHRYTGAGPDGPPPPSEDDLQAWREIDAAIADEMGLDPEQ
jgi:RecA-family ATPase